MSFFKTSGNELKSIYVRIGMCVGNNMHFSVYIPPHTHILGFPSSMFVTKLHCTTARMQHTLLYYHTRYVPSREGYICFHRYKSALSSTLSYVVGHVNKPRYNVLMTYNQSKQTAIYKCCCPTHLQVVSSTLVRTNFYPKLCY